MQRRSFFLTLTTALLAGGVRADPAKPDKALTAPSSEEIAIWPEGVLTPPAEPATPDPAAPTIVPSAHLPTLGIYRPEKPNGAAILMCGGGGYLLVGRGGGIPRWFNARGITVFDLRYRLPGVGWAAGGDAPLQDAQRAMRLIRQNATQYGIDPERVGVAGFSSGGHLAAMLATAFDETTQADPYPNDRRSARPDFAILGCPVITMTAPYAHGSSFRQLMGSDRSEMRIQRYSAEQRATRESPPFLIGHASDDGVVRLENSLMLLTALRKAGVSTELHAFQTGGHNFGQAFQEGTPLSAFSGLMMDWLGRNGWLEGGAA